MRRLFQVLVNDLIVALIAAPAFAAKKDKNKGSDPTASIKKKLDAADLPSDVREKVNNVLAEDSPKLKEAQAKIDTILTNEQKQAKRAAQKEARTNGTKGKNARASIDAALRLTDEQ